MAAHTESLAVATPVLETLTGLNSGRKRTGDVVPLERLLKPQIVSAEPKDLWPPAKPWKRSSFSSYLPEQMPVEEKLERAYAKAAMDYAWRNTSHFIKNQRYYSGEPLDRIQGKMRGLKRALEGMSVPVPSVQVILDKGRPSPTILAIGRSFVKVHGKNS